MRSGGFCIFGGESLKLSMTMKKLLWFLPLSFISYMSPAQEKWDLTKCVNYALANNISIKQADVQARISRLTLNQSKLSQIPTLSFSTALGLNSGNALNQANYTIENQTFFNNNLALQSSVVLFNGFNLQNIIASNRFAWQAALATTEKTKNDVSLNVANAYLQVLLARAVYRGPDAHTVSSTRRARATSSRSARSRTSPRSWRACSRARRPARASRS